MRGAINRHHYLWSGVCFRLGSHLSPQLPTRRHHSYLQPVLPAHQAPPYVERDQCRPTTSSTPP
eukprot:8010850-Pyramimonas_sp.AAC.1